LSKQNLAHDFRPAPLVEADLAETGKGTEEARMDEPRGASVPVPRPQTQGPDPLIGRIVNERYRIVGTIARGGMGKVYRAEQQPLGRLVALKVLNPNYTGENDPEFHKRFFLEASIASKLTHPNTVTIFDYGRTDDEVFYIAMELLEGRTMHRALREEAPFPADRAMHIARQICRSLREAHGLGVIHRDLKPANIYLMQHGDESDFVKVLDFGLVKNVDEKGGEELTQTGLFMGSPKYMSPEQIRGDRVDGRVDVYALGVILFEMLTGRVPFDRANSVNILMAHIQEDVPSMKAFNPEVHVPPALEALVRRCMAKDPALRYASMDEVLAGLKQCSGISTTMSGEVRLADVLGPNGLALDGSNPSSSSVHLRGEFATGAPYPSVAASTTPQGIPPVSAQLGQPAPAPKSGKTKWLVAAAIALVAAGGALGLIPSKSVLPQQTKAAAKQQVAPVATTAAAAAQPVTGSVTPPVLATDPTPAEPSSATLQAFTTVLVSLKSTPPGAMVVVGEREYGPTPTQVEWTGPEAATGREVTFRFQRKGYRDLTVTRQIRSDRLEVEAPPMDPMPVKRLVAREERAPGAASGVAAPVTSVKGYKAEPY
jgi:serine/threonine protein kinase